MGCFLVPATEAIVTTVVTKVVEKKEGSLENVEKKELFSTKLKRLNGFLWGGSALLAFEHLWHGEVQPFFPFITAMSNPEDMSELLHEMSTVGVSMAVLVTAVWAILTIAISRIEKKSAKTEDIA